MLKLESLKNDNHFISSRNYAAAYHQALEEVPRNLVPEKIKTIQKNFKKFSFFEIAVIKNLKNNLLHVEAMQ